VAERIAHKDEPPRYPGGIPTIKHTSFPSEQQIAQDSMYSLRTVVACIAKLTNTWTNNPTGKPYITIEEIPGRQNHRYRINVPLFDSMSSPKNVTAIAVAPADSADCLDHEAEVAPREFLPVVEGDPSNALARRYWDALGNDPRWLGSGNAWQTEFNKALESHSYEQLSGAMTWALHDDFWSQRVSASSKQQVVPYALSKIDEIMPRYLKSVSPRSSPSTYTNRSPAANSAAIQTFNFAPPSQKA
jgi:hypothetical protein